MSLRSRVGVTLIRIAALYMLAALGLGMVMAMSHDFSLVSVHSHVGLLGWATMAIIGLVYLELPRCAASKLATAHFWLHNIGLPVMMGGLVVVTTSGSAAAEPVIGIGASLVFAALVVFTINVFRNGNGPEAPSS